MAVIAGACGHFFFNLVTEIFTYDSTTLKTLVQECCYLIQSKEIISKLSSIHVPVVFLNSCFDKIVKLY
jgi:hypothetical protein